MNKLCLLLTELTNSRDSLEVVGVVGGVAVVGDCRSGYKSKSCRA